MKKACKANLPALIFLLVLVMVWQAGAMGMNASYILPTPIEILQRLWDTVKGPRLHLKGQLVDDIEVLRGILVGHPAKFQGAHGSSLHAISQKPSSYRLHATKMSSSR